MIRKTPQFPVNMSEAGQRLGRLIRVQYDPEHPGFRRPVAEGGPSGPGRGGRRPADGAADG